MSRIAEITRLTAAVGSHRVALAKNQARLDHVTKGYRQPVVEALHNMIESTIERDQASLDAVLAEEIV